MAWCCSHIAADFAIRVGPSSLTLFAGTILAGGAIAIGNVLLPALVKRDFPTRAGAITGGYTMALQISAALAAGLSVPVAAAIGGWRGGLGIWARPPWYPGGLAAPASSSDVPPRDHAGKRPGRCCGIRSRGR